jgi:hypothetical protein
MRVRSLAGGIAILAALLLLPASALGLSKTQGADLSAPSDAGFGCETQFLPGNPGNGFTYEPSPFEGIVDESSCTMWAYTGGTTDKLLAPASGTVTKVRVKSGPNPAPLRVSILRYLFTTNPANPSEVTDRQCCTAVAEGATFQPTPNAVTETTVNLPTQVVQPQGQQSGWGDFVGVSAVGPGTVPLNSTGPHTSYAINTPTVHFAYPKISPPRDYSDGSFAYPNYQPLIQFDWTDGCAGSAGVKARASQCSKGNAGQGGKAVKAPFSVLSKSLRLKDGKVKVSVRCTAAKGQKCKGSVGLRTRAKKPKALASKKVSVKGGKKASVTLKLSRKARKRVPRKKNKVTVTVNLGAQGKATRNVTLKR